MRDRLKRMILERAFRYSEEPVFKLAYGGVSRFYFNCKRVTLDPEGQVLVGQLVLQTIRDPAVVAVGGLTLGADPISNAVAYTSWLQHRPLQAFVVRKQEKDHGEVNRIEGNVRRGDSVVVVDDVITTGGSTLQAIAACQAAGLQVVQVIAIVDRQEMNGRENILDRVPHFDALTTRDEMLDLFLKGSGH